MTFPVTSKGQDVPSQGYWLSCTHPTDGLIYDKSLRCFFYRGLLIKFHSIPYTTSILLPRPWWLQRRDYWDFQKLPHCVLLFNPLPFIPLLDPLKYIQVLCLIILLGMDLDPHLPAVLATLKGFLSSTLLIMEIEDLR